MTGLKLVAIFLVVLILDGLILPAFFGLRESFLSLLILIVPVLYMGSTRRTVVYCLAFVFVSESLRGLNVGDLAIPFLLTATIVYLIQRFLDIKCTYETRFGLSKSVLIATMSVVCLYIFSFFYKHGGVNIDYFNSVISVTIALEAM